MLNIKTLIDKILTKLRTLQTSVDGKVSKTGDTMTGNLIMNTNASIINKITGSQGENTIEIDGRSLTLNSYEYDKICELNTSPYFTLGTRNSSTIGNFSVAEGYLVSAERDYSIAQNFGTTAIGKASTVIGTYNALDTIPSTAVHAGGTDYGNYAFIIGNGTASSRQSAFRVTWNGNIDMGSASNSTCWIRTRTTNNTQIPIYIYDEGDAYGQNVVIGAGGSTILGAGEAAGALYTANPNSIQTGAENLHLAADGNIYFYTNCNTIGNRVQSYIDTAGQVFWAGHTTRMGAEVTNSGTVNKASGTDFVNLGTITLPVGSWVLCWSVYCDVNTADKRLSARLYNNTSAAAWNWSRCTSHTSSTAATAVAGSMTINISTSTVVAVQAYQNSGSAKDISFYVRAMRIW